MPTWEDLLRQKGQQMQQAGSNMINQNIDQPMTAKLNALQQQANPTVSAPVPGQIQPPASGVPEVLPNAPSMSPADAQNRAAAMVQAPLTMQQVAAKLRNQAD